MQMRRLVAVGAVAVLVLLLAVLGGRFERARWIDRQTDGIAAARAAVGAQFLHPKAYRMAPLFDCLLYGSYGAGNSRELCFAPSGRIVEAIDRQIGHLPKIWSLRAEPNASTVRVDPREVARMLDKMGGQTGNAIVVGEPDLGATYPVGAKLP